MWFLIAIVMALIALAIYSFMTGGIVKKGMQTIGLIQGDSDLRAKCTVLIPGTDGDTNGDGIKDIPACSSLVKSKDDK